MKHWYLVEEKDGSFFETKLKAESKEDAAREAGNYIDYLTKKERAAETIYIIHADIDAACEAGESYFEAEYCDDQAEL